MRSVRAIEHSDVCILMVDATTGFESQDQRIFHIADRNKKGVVILVNKWDLKDKSTETANKVEEEIRKKIAPFSDVPILFISVLEKQRLLKGLEWLLRFIKTDLRGLVPKIKWHYLPFINKVPPPTIKGKYIKIKYCTQLPTQLNIYFFANLLNILKNHIKDTLKIN